MVEEDTAKEDRLLKKDQFLSTPGGARLLAVLEGANGKGTVTDIEIVAHDLVRYGILKKLKIAEGDFKFTQEELRTLLDLIMPPNKESKGRSLYQLLPDSWSFSVKDVGHYRVLGVRTKNGIGLSLRKLPFTIPDIDGMGIPQSAVNAFLNNPHGLFLVTGPTGSGKTTTIASLIEKVNQTTYGKVVTVEDPIEYVFLNGTCSFCQMEVGTDIASINDALKHVVRSNPEMLFIGEVRSPEEAAACLSASERGGRVITSFHVPDTVAAIERFINDASSAKGGSIDMAKRILASSLIGVLNQRLIVTRPTKGDSAGDSARFVYCCEFLPVCNNPGAQKKILDMQFKELRNSLVTPSAVNRERGVVSYQDSVQDIMARGLAQMEDVRNFTYYDVFNLPSSETAA